MKKLLLMLAIFVIGCGGGSNTKVNEQNMLELRGRGYQYYIDTFEYQGCEYVIVSHEGHMSVTHKGNCKFCKDRDLDFPPCKSHELTGPPK